MKKLTNLLFMFSIAFYSAGQIPTQQNKSLKNIKTSEEKDVLLVYAGNLKGYMNLGFGLHVEIDSLIGIRCGAVIERETAILGNTALFYKFSNPTQAIYYNYITKQTSIENRSVSPGKDLKLTVIGNEIIDSFSCIHLHHEEHTNVVADYWMSRAVPGFTQLVAIFKKMDPSLTSAFLSSAIFNWGGLVMMKSTYTNEKTGKSSSMILKLVEANPNMSFPASDFDVPQDKKN